jgi:thiol-disulfide isomerase/thioredoxin
MWKAILCTILLLACSCTRRASGPIASYIENKHGGVFVFLATDCPLSQNYMPTMNQLSKQFAPNDIGFYGVFSQEDLSPKILNDFTTSYGMSFPAIRDEQFKLADSFDATTTPQAFLVDLTGQTLYKGAIDNWAPELGQHRTVITEHYLLNALESLRDSKPVKVKGTPAVGCFIERKNQG